MPDEPRSAGRFALLGTAFMLTPIALGGIVLGTVFILMLGLIPVWVGIPAALAVALFTRNFTDLHRLWLAQRFGARVERPYIPDTGQGLHLRFLIILKDPATWRDHAWLWVNGTAGLALLVSTFAIFIAAVGGLTMPLWWLFLPADAKYDVFGIPGGLTIDDSGSAVTYGIPMGLVYLGLWWWVTPVFMRAYAWLATSLLGPTTETRLADRVRQLTVSRAETVDTQAAEIRRIERDLHDGAQARLVALGMSLGMAEEMIDRDPEAAAKLLAEARENSGQALMELRHLVRGIHPPVLADRGLEGAVRALALTYALDIEVDIDLPGRPPAPVESAGYFAVAEALTNVVKHSGATRAWVRAMYIRGQLAMLVGDDGHGGALVNPGGGLDGVARRLSAFDGTVAVRSPVGGPTIVTMEIPCDLYVTEGRHE